jgi:hypothetical protein
MSVDGSQTDPDTESSARQRTIIAGDQRPQPLALDCGLRAGIDIVRLRKSGQLFKPIHAAPPGQQIGSWDDSGLSDNIFLGDRFNCALAAQIGP